MNYLERSVTKCNRACGFRQASLISDIHHTTNYKQCCQVGDQATDCKLIIPRRWFCRQKMNIRRRSLNIWITYVCAVFMGSLDAGLRMEGIPAMILGDAIIDILQLPSWRRLPSLFIKLGSYHIRKNLGTNFLPPNALLFSIEDSKLS